MLVSNNYRSRSRVKIQDKTELATIKLYRLRLRKKNGKSSTLAHFGARIQFAGSDVWHVCRYKCDAIERIAAVLKGLRFGTGEIGERAERREA